MLRITLRHTLSAFLLLLCAGAGLSMLPGTAAQAATLLDSIKARGTLHCGVSEGIPGFSLADKGHKEALLANPNFLKGLNVHRGQVTYEAVAQNLGYSYVDPAEALAA